MTGLLTATSVQGTGAAEKQRSAKSVSQNQRMVTVHPKSGEARVVSLEVVNDRIIRVRATGAADKLPTKPQSLIVVPQVNKKVPQFDVQESDEAVYVKTAEMKAVVDKETGAVSFFDKDGKRLLGESKDGKRFWPYRVPDREIGVDVSKVSEKQRNGLSWQLTFDRTGDELYGLGQHQSEELNMADKNEDLFQYNTKVSVPFVVGNSRSSEGGVRNYGILWDAYSYCRFGMPEEYLQLNRAFKLYDKQGREGHLTGTYTDRNGRTLTRDEDSIYFEYDLPDKQQCNDAGGIKNLPKGFNLNGAKVVYEGFIENAHQAGIFSYTRDFILYYAGYVKVYIGGKLVVPERWRTAWNPNTYKFTARIPEKEKVQLRIEWQPDGSVSYCGLRVAPPTNYGALRQLRVWCEMAQDMDYYFIVGHTMDEVISGYRTLTGKAPVYPKWVLGYWQSRERYKTQDELLSTLAEFRQRHLPIDNIVQDWNYWPEDQWGSHQFEASRYPNPQQMIDSVHQMHGRFMISVWPKFYVNTQNYKELDKKGWMYHQAVTDDIHDWVGPGYVGSFYDAYSEKARKMFWRQLAPLSPPEGGTIDTSANKTNEAPSGAVGRATIDAWWMDASEPNVRDCTPMWYRKALCGPTALGTSTESFNAYALVNAQAIYEGQRGSAPAPKGATIASNGKTNEAPSGAVGGASRVFLLTRSGFAGLQRYSTATWSGDIGTRWEDMRAQMTAGMNYSLSGLPFWGMDNGGFCVENRYVRAQQLYDRTKQENEDLKEWRELQTRWNQFGCFVPLYRAHGQWPLREPWNIAPEGHPAYRSFAYYDQLRYRLMPYLYSMAGWVHLNDYTMMRALVMDFGYDNKVIDIKDQWMFGPSLMACPVSEYKARNRSVYFPKGRGWYDLYTGEKMMEKEEAGNASQETVHPKPVNRQLIVDAPYERIPLFVPEGSILPFGPAMEWCDEHPAELIHLYIYSGRDAHFSLYEDEGTNYNYEQGQFATIDIRYDEASKTVTFGQRNGSFKGMLEKRRFNIVFVTKDHPQPLNLDAPQGVMVNYDGTQQRIKLQ